MTLDIDQGVPPFLQGKMCLDVEQYLGVNLRKQSGTAAHPR